MDSDAVDIAKVLRTECGNASSKTEQACVAWVIINRSDAWGKPIHDIVREPNQFRFSEDTDIDANLLELAYDVLNRRDSGEGKVLPDDYLYFSGDGEKNYFSNSVGAIWDYSSETPYDD